MIAQSEFLKWLSKEKHIFLYTEAQCKVLLEDFEDLIKALEKKNISPELKALLEESKVNYTLPIKNLLKIGNVGTDEFPIEGNMFVKPILHTYIFIDDARAVHESVFNSFCNVSKMLYMGTTGHIKVEENEDKFIY